MFASGVYREYYNLGVTIGRLTDAPVLESREGIIDWDSIPFASFLAWANNQNNADFGPEYCGVGGKVVLTASTLTAMLQK